MRDLTDKEAEIYNSWLEAESEDTGVTVPKLEDGTFGYIDVGRLCDYANNMTVGVTSNDIMRFPRANVKPVIYAYKTVNVGLRSYCSNCGRLAYMENFCSHCGAEVEK